MDRRSMNSALSWQASDQKRLVRASQNFALGPLVTHTPAQRPSMATVWTYTGHGLSPRSWIMIISMLLILVAYCYGEIPLLFDPINWIASPSGLEPRVVPWLYLVEKKPSTPGRTRITTLSTIPNRVKQALRSPADTFASQWNKLHYPILHIKQGGMDLSCHTAPSSHKEGSRTGCELQYFCTVLLLSMEVKGVRRQRGTARIRPTYGRRHVARCRRRRRGPSRATNSPATQPAERSSHCTGR
jgi:hypothetical protein